MTDGVGQVQVQLARPGMTCEHAYILQHDDDATPADLMLLPNAYLEDLGSCGKPAHYHLTIYDGWNEDMGAEADEYDYCTEHAESMMRALGLDWEGR